MIHVLSVNQPIPREPMLHSLLEMPLDSLQLEKIYKAPAAVLSKILPR
jgi:hypothetical protein